MPENVDVMKHIREEQLTRVVQSLGFLGAVLLVASFSRMFILGWNNLMYFHISAYLAVLGIAVFRKHIPHNLKTVLLIGIIFILSLAGLYVLGLVGHGVGGFLILCIISTIFFGTWGGITAVVVSTISISVVGTAFVNKFITLKFNVVEYMSSTGAWITCVIGMIILAGLIVTLISTINSQLLKLVQNLNLQNAELKEANKKLEEAIEEQKRLKTGLEQAQKMELVGTIAGGVVHDLNNVLAASISYPELLLLKVPEDSPLREPLKTIKKSGLKAAAIVQDLLTLSRRRVASREVLNINNIIMECISGPEVERILAFHPGVKIEMNLEESLWNVDGYPLHLSKTLANLISNAAESISGAGNIKLKTSNMSITGENNIHKEIDSGEYTLLTVSDNGEGISEEDQGKIFEPFYTKKEMGRSGTGLGMTVVWNTVKDHDGYIFLDSKKGKGTTFYLYLPKTDKLLPAKKEKPEISSLPGKGESILIVDDVKEQREIAASILSTLGYNVITKTNGREALEFLHQNSSDLVILDMVMPKGLDGLDTYRKILDIRPDQRTIIISGFSETERIKEALKLGAGAYVKKPYLMETIAHAVREELDKGLPGKSVCN